MCVFRVPLNVAQQSSTVRNMRAPWNRHGISAVG